MTIEEQQEYLEYWKIPLLETYIEKLEEGFAAEVAKNCIENNFINVLIRSYPHCILVLKEVLCLVANGFPDGALARARRIYENMIIAQYLNLHKHDSDFDKIIERYFDDQNIRAYDGRKKYYDAIKDRQNADAYNKKMNAIIKKYASPQEFKVKKRKILTNNYWWVNNSPMSFATLSKCFEVDEVKVFYLRACYSIHAGALGDVALLGRPLSAELQLHTGRTYNGAAMALLLAVSSFGYLTEIMFENFAVDPPVHGNCFLDLLNIYFNNSAEENKAFMKMKKNDSVMRK